LDSISQLAFPNNYTEKVGIKNWRKSLKDFGDKTWKNFYIRSDHPTLHQPFFPKNSNLRGKLKTKLATDLGCGDFSELKRLCDKQSNQGACFVPRYAGYFLHLPRYAFYTELSEPVNSLFY
jgi:hypothetical protein